MKISENLIQQQALIWFTTNYCLIHHNPRCVIFSVPNESSNGWEGKKKVNIGLLSGVADMVLLLPNGVSIFMECKSQTGSQSKTQKDFEQRVKSLGFNYYIFRSLEEFKNIIIPHVTWLKKY